MGQGVSGSHKIIEKSEETIPTVSNEYEFLNDKQEVAQEKEEGTCNPILSIRERNTGIIQSRVVPMRGTDKLAIRRLQKDIEMSGYKKIILTSDNESSILALTQPVK